MLEKNGDVEGSRVSPADAIAAWRARLGADAVTTDDAALAASQRNVTEYAPRRVTAILRPSSRAEVEDVIAIARAHRAPLYPMSLGRNWGVGSRLPIADGCAIVELGRMTALRISTAHGYAVVEPGVTQGQLHEALRGTGLMFNVTGSGARTSILGNLLDRGVGMIGSRTADLRALEVVTGSGQLVRTGLWHAAGDDERFEHPLPAGLGPDLGPLFLQSAFGIATAAVITLRPAQRPALAVIQIPDDALPGLVDTLGALRRAEHLRDRIEIDADDDPRLVGLVDGRTGDRRWIAWVPLWGEPDLIAPVVARLRAAFPQLRLFAADADPDGPEGDPASFPEPVAVRLDRLAGKPGDHGLLALARLGGVDLGDRPEELDLLDAIPGFVCVLPAVPLDGAAVTRLLAVVDATGAELGVQGYVSLNTIGPHVFEGYLRAGFDRRKPDDAARAQHWSRVLHARLADAGIHPLRLDVERMQDLRPDGFWRAVAEIKRALDPDGIIAPGRYCP